MKQIELTKGHYARIDDEDLDLVSQYTWRANETKDGGIYAQSGQGGKYPTIMMHRLIMKAPKGTEVDHQDHNGLNNQKSNLRLCTRAQNAANQAKQRTPRSSRYKGVYWFSPKRYQGRWGKWAAMIQKGKKRKHLGYFASEESAARAYDQAALETFGEFACLNFPLTKAQ